MFDLVSRIQKKLTDRYSQKFCKWTIEKEWNIQKHN